MQVVEINAEAVAVGEVAVVTPSAGEVGIDVEAEADVTDKDERRCGFIGR